MAPRNEEAPEDWQVNYAEIRLRSAHLFRSRHWTDCSFKFETGRVAGGQGTLEAHKLILAMASPVFAAMFYGDVGEKANPVIISDIDQPTFLTLLQYIYTDDAVIHSKDAAIDLYKAANKYLLIHLEDRCLDYLSKILDPENVCQIYEFSRFFEQNLLEEKCLEIFRTKTQYVLKSPSFLNADVSTLQKIVSLDIVDINSEMELYDAVLHFADNFKTSDEDSIPLDAPLEKKKKVEEDDNQLSNESSANGLLIKNPLVPIKDARQMLQGILEEIRFLSMTPADLAKVSESNKLLSVDEVRALFTNKFSPESSIPMPAGFSTIREPRFRSAATIRHTINNVTSMDLTMKEYSAPVLVSNVPWRMKMYRYRTVSDGQIEDSLAVYLECNAENMSDDWYCYAKAEVCLFSNANCTTYKKVHGKMHKFRKSGAWGWRHFMPWDDLINPENNFIKDDSITLNMHFYTTSPLQRVEY
ncbi:BTB/POZ domain-containing protein [Phthorimaea operculella]|nr:BTB/POZ domain-containing protein [Phthorimaea operculella]